jgi:glutathione S-transferase
VIIYLAEKGIDLPRRDVNLAAGEQKSPEFLALNPAGKVPILVLDDGSVLSESGAIVEYLEELYPDPPMLGVTPLARARVRALERMAHDLIGRSSMWLMHFHPYFAGRIKPDALVAAASKPFVDESLAALEAHIGDNAFLAGPTPTIADCTLFAVFQTCRERLEVRLGEGYPRLEAWHERFAARPSAAYAD